MDSQRFFVDPDIRKAETLPPEAFTSKEFLDAEIKGIFMKESLAALQVNIGDLKSDGVAAFELLEHKLLLVEAKRKKQGIKCLSGVCTHQGNLLVDEAEICKNVLTCGLHGRTFDLDGKCISHWPN